MNVDRIDTISRNNDSVCMRTQTHSERNRNFGIVAFGIVVAVFIRILTSLQIAIVRIFPFFIAWSCFLGIIKVFTGFENNRDHADLFEAIVIPKADSPVTTSGDAPCFSISRRAFGYGIHRRDEQVVPQQVILCYVSLGKARYPNLFVTVRSEKQLSPKLVIYNLQSCQDRCRVPQE